MTLKFFPLLSSLVIVVYLLIAESASAQSGDLSGGLSAAAGKPFSLPATDPKLERNKKNVLAFYDLMFNQSKPAEAVRLYTGATYIQHNPEVADGKEAFIAFFEKMARDYPEKSVEFKRVFAEGNYVILHSDHRFPGWRGGSWAAMDIFRLDPDGKLLEHWDVLQKVPGKSANSNGMF
ncbi:MAG: nuclear transport factor 2 family protein [Burkholderiaceae bacterium]